MRKEQHFYAEDEDEAGGGQAVQDHRYRPAQAEPRLEAAQARGQVAQAQAALRKAVLVAKADEPRLKRLVPYL